MDLEDLFIVASFTLLKSVVYSTEGEKEYQYYTAVNLVSFNNKDRPISAIVV